MAEHVEVAKNSAFAGLIITEQTFEEVPEEVRCPPELEYIWGYFRDLDGTRKNSGMGFCPIEHTEITAWSDGMQIGITPFERMCIRAVDEAYRQHCNMKDKKRG